MRSLRQQLTLSLIVAIAFLLSAGGGAAYFAIRKSLQDQFDAALRVKALIVITDTQVAGGRIRVYFSDRFLREFDDALATEFFQVFDASGRPVEHSDSLVTGSILPLHTGTPAEPAFWNMTLPSGEPGRAVGIRFQPQRSPARSTVSAPEAPLEASVVVAASRRSLDQTLTELRQVLSGVGLAALLLTALLVPWTLRRAMRPLDKLAAAAGGIDARSLNQRFDTQPLPRELQLIGLRLNDLLSRLEASFERERRFSADIAHELRTPLAELRTMAEVALKWPQERSMAVDQSTLEIALQMERLVARLLALGRAEQGQEALDIRLFDPGPLLDALLVSVAAMAQERSIDLQKDLRPVGPVQSDVVVLRSVLSNVLENAVSYAPRGSWVRLTWIQDSKGVVCSVANPTDNLTADDLPRLFERFWRKDAARTSGGAHSGLGLALSRSLAQRLSGELRAELDERRVLTLTFRLPQATDAQVRPS